MKIPVAQGAGILFLLLAANYISLFDWHFIELNCIGKLVTKVLSNEIPRIKMRRIKPNNISSLII